MAEKRKTQQLQIRVSAAEKREIQRRAQAAGLSLSSWVLGRALPSKTEAFQRLLADLSHAVQPSFVLAEMSDLLARLSTSEFPTVLELPPQTKLSLLHRTYVAAMVEHTATRMQVAVPDWALHTPALEQPYFASSLKSLRLHLLSSAPPAFRRRNLFVDASVGERI